jgi:two-component system chemotaxis response regulator CheB
MRMNPAEAGPPRRDLVVIGASAGGVSALLELCAALPSKLPAAVLIVLHVGTNPSVLPMLLSARGHNRAVHAEDGQTIETGTLYVAPPDHHMLVKDGAIRLTRGAKEHHTRPAIDPLFRSTALAFGPRVIGVVLTGRLDDGTAGLVAIKRCGGVAVVQDPADAEHPTMPQSAIQSVDVDRVVPLARMGETLMQLIEEPAPATADDDSARRRLELEMDVTEHTDSAIENLNTLGKPSTFACPDCNGVLWEIADTHPVRFRCHTGHAFSLRSLEATQATATEDAIWGALRALQMREEVLRRLAAQLRTSRVDDEAQRTEAKADEAARHARTLRGLLERADDVAPSSSSDVVPGYATS